MTTGKARKNTRCLECDSPRTQRCEIVHEAGHSTVTGPRYTTTRTSALAQRVGPPQGPLDPAVAWGLLLFLGTPGAVIFLGALFFLVKFHTLFALVPLAVGLILLTAANGYRASLGKRKYAQDLAEYKENMDLYKRLWICRDCGHIFLPEK